MMRSEPKLSSPASGKWPYPEELWSHNDHPFIDGNYRNNRFRSTSTPIRGLTSSVMIQVATVIYARQPSFQAFAEGAVPMAKIIEKSIQEARTGATLPAYLREPTRTPDIGMSRAPTPMLPPSEVRDTGSFLSVKDGEQVGEGTVSVEPA